MSEYKHLIDGYENTRVIRYDQADELPNQIDFSMLPESEVRGVLKGNRHVDGKLKQIYSVKDNHVGVIAGTRLGKTTGYVIPTILSFATQKVKKSMFISDPKGEVYRHTSEYLRSQGYKVFVYNFRDYLHSEYWNPLTPLFRKYRKAMAAADDVTVVNTENGLRNCFNGRIFEDQRELDEEVETFKQILLDDVGKDIDDIGLLFVTTESKNDVYWEDAARDVLKAFLWAMLEDSNKPVNPITEETFSFSTILSITLHIQTGRGRDFEDGGYFTNRNDSSKAYQIIKDCLINNGDVTRACIMGVFNTKISVFRESAIRLVTSCNSLDLSVLDDGPTAIFINYRDEIKAHYNLISLLFQDAYRYLIKQTDERPKGELDTPFYFILDEFGNFPQIKNFEVTISACAGRNIWFIIMLQSYAQLDNVYGSDRAKIILDNLNVHVFMGSNNPETLESFSRECGQKTRISPVSALNGSKEEIDHFQIETIAAVPKSRLSRLEEGECIITEANCGYVLFAKLDRYYALEEMNNLPLADIHDYISTINPFDKRYKYKYQADSNKKSFI